MPRLALASLLLALFAAPLAVGETAKPKSTATPAKKPAAKPKTATSAKPKPSPAVAKKADSKPAGPRVYSPTKTPATPSVAVAKPGPKVVVPSAPTYAVPPFFPWKKGITSTVFWIGEMPTEGNPTPNHMSAWDTNWASNYGGYDDPNPAHRVGFLPRFMPMQNPFYVALPYNDVSGGETKPEAARVIPWFKSRSKKPGQTVCRGQWIAIRHKGRVCFAQWEDVGPFETDDWMYVFGNARPKTQGNGGAGIDVSPAIRDFLKIKSGAPVDWRFVSLSEVGAGPWRMYGNNNHFVQMGRAGQNAPTINYSRPLPPPKPKTVEELYRSREQWFQRYSGG